MRVGLVSRGADGPTGTSRYASSLHRALLAIGADVVCPRASGPGLGPWATGPLRGLGFDPDRFFDSYPIGVERRPVDLYHLTSQTLGTLLISHRFDRPVVITVLDILPYQLRRDRQLRTFRHPVDEIFYRLALAGIRRAARIIAISDHTRRSLTATLGIDRERVQVVHLGVDGGLFRPGGDELAVRARFGWEPKDQIVLYVGSDDPRKNLPVLVRAFAGVLARLPRARLVLLGSAQFPGERGRLQELATRLRIGDRLQFLSGSGDEALAEIYRAVDVLALPSPHEGFGLPAIEAMACGLPVICAAAGSLPEIVGDAGALVSPTAEADWQAEIVRILDDRNMRAAMSERGLIRAAQFTWARTADQTKAIYTGLLA